MNPAIAMALPTVRRLNSLRRKLMATSALVSVSPLVPAQAGVDLDVPFITTPDTVVLAMLDLAKVGARDMVLDLGSGDGRIPIMAATRYGARAGGVELDPRLVATSTSLAARAGVGQRVWFRQQDLFETDLTEASVITMYLLPDVNLKLRPRLLGLRPGTRIVSHDWDMGEWIADQDITVPAPNKPVGRLKQARLMLWVVPQDFSTMRSGTLHWAHEPGNPQPVEVKLRQRFQIIEAGSITTSAGVAWEIVAGKVSAGLVELRMAAQAQRASVVGRSGPKGLELRAVREPS